MAASTSTDAELTLAEINTLQQEFETLKQKYLNTFCRCWVLFTLREYEKRGSQGTEFVCRKGYEKDTEEELKALVFSKKETYIIIPALKNGLGEFCTLNKKSLKSTFHTYMGPCQLLKKGRWIHGTRLEGGIESDPAVFSAKEKNPACKCNPTNCNCVDQCDDKYGIDIGWA
jgi:hypothetical protein